MPDPISFGELSFEIVSSMDETQATPDPETPFRIALLGDFSGRASRHLKPIEQLRAIPVDRDTLDAVITKLGVEVHLSLTEDNKALVLRFDELEDFHPDRIFQRLDIFQELRTLRHDLNDNSTFAAAADKVRNWLHGETSGPEDEAEKKVKEQSPEPVAEKMSGSLLDQVVAETTGQAVEPEPAPTTHASSDLDDFISQIVKPHLVADADPQREQLLAVIDTAISQVMEAILHHPEFQAIESAWREVYFLISRLETGVELKLYLFDISKGELAADLNSSEDLSTTALYRHFVEQAVETFGGMPWGLLAGNFFFEPNLADIQTLGRMAKIARLAGAPFIGGAHERFLGCDSLHENPHPDTWRLAITPDTAKAWNMLRQLPEASSLGLALPRFLLRLPYGADTDETDTFDFEEMGPPPDHDSYLWGNAAVACTCLVGMAFCRSGWQLRPGEVQEITSLPLHVYKDDGASKIKPCAEVVFTQKAAELILDKGLMVLLSFLNQDIVRLGRFQSIADPPTQLAGRWG